MSNPFTLSFGKKPAQFISRITQTNEIVENFRADVPSNQIYMLTGVRGSGKTVMMTTVSNIIAEDNNWITLELNPARDLLQSLAAKLYGIPELHTLFLKAKFDFSAFGLGVSIENAAPVTDIETAISLMLGVLKEEGKRLLITIDEATNSDNIRVFASSFQIFLRQDYPVFLLMTGLYDNLYDLQNEKSLTFLYRAPKIVLDPLNYTAVKKHYMDIFGLTIEEILPEYDQYLEEYVYSKIWSEMSELDKKIVYEMSVSGETKIKNIREKLGMKSELFSVYRDRLKRKGVVNTQEYGHLSLALPRFDDFVKARLI